jgi:hypothetical protein
VVGVVFDNGTDLVGEETVLVDQELAHTEDAGRVAVADPQPDK